MPTPAEQPALFDLEPDAPTTRTVADLVREGGIAALTDADHRSDHATYQEVRCRSALNRVAGMPFEWTLNPYRGCTHGCHYCYARRYHRQFELGTDDFASIILVKTNLVEILRRELQRPSWQRQTVALGTATDCYQPIEGHYRLTRGALEAFIESRTPVSVVTKGPMVQRDADLLLELTARAGCTVCVSIPCVDDEISRTLEPGTAPPLQRLRTVQALVARGINAGVLMSPIVPGISSHPRLLERTVRASAEHGARFVGCGVMHLDDGVRQHFLDWLGREYPALVEGYRRLYAGKYAPEPYRAQVVQIVGAAKSKYGVGGDRPKRGGNPE